MMLGVITLFLVLSAVDGFVFPRSYHLVPPPKLDKLQTTVAAPLVRSSSSLSGFKIPVFYSNRNASDRCDDDDNDDDDDDDDDNDDDMENAEFKRDLDRLSDHFHNFLSKHSGNSELEPRKRSIFSDIESGWNRAWKFTGGIILAFYMAKWASLFLDFLAVNLPPFHDILLWIDYITVDPWVKGWFLAVLLFKIFSRTVMNEKIPGREIRDSLMNVFFILFRERSVEATLAEAAAAAAGSATVSK